MELPLMSLQLTIDYPENLPLALQKTREEFEREAKWAMAVKLFVSEADFVGDGGEFALE